jgi:hypothetical protein
MQTGKKREKKRENKKTKQKKQQQSKAADLEYQHLLVCLIKKNRTFSKKNELVWSLYASIPNNSVSILI